MTGTQNRVSGMPDTNNGPRPVKALVIALCLTGIFLRLYFYAIDRSLWIDEARLALNLVNRSFLDLLKPLDFDQGAPIGFLLLEKTVMSLLGRSDYTLRLVPLLAGIASVPLVYATARRYTGKLASFTSLGLFALSPRLIYYSSELKQYSTDVVMTLLLLFIVPECLEERPKPRAFVALGVAGSFAIWISHPTLFVSAGILLTLGLAFALRKDSYRLLWVIGIGGLWTINLVLIYLISLQYLTANNTLLNFWSRGFAPLPPWSNFTWYYEALGGMLHDPAGLPMSAITVSLLLLGVLSYALRRWQLTFALLVPFLLTLIASAFRNYPFSGRLLLFLIPLLLLLLAEGVERVRVSLLRVNRPMAFVVSAFLVVYLFYDPVIVTYKRLRSPPMGEHIKPLLARVSRDRLGADSIYVYYGAGPAFEFYAPLYGFARNDYILGSSARNDPDKYLRDIDKLKGGRRVWFVFSHNCSWCAVNEQLFILEHLDKIGLRRSEFLSDAASLYLYDLTPLR